MKLFLFVVNVRKVHGLCITGQHNVYVVAKDISEALTAFNKDFKDGEVEIKTTEQVSGKVIA